MNSAAPRIERSTCVSAAKLTTASQPSPALATASASQMSPSTSCVSQPSRFAGLPEYVSLSSTTTSSPAATRRLTKCEPMNPAPPVTRIRTAPKASGRVRSATTGVRHRISSRGKCAEIGTTHPSSRRARHARSPSRQCGSLGAPSRSERSTEYAGRGAGRPSSAVVIGRTRHSIPASSKIACANSNQCTPRRRRRARRRARRGRRARAPPPRGGPTYVGQPTWSSTTATSSCSRPSRSIVRTKLWPLGPKSHDERTISAFSPAAPSEWSFERPYAESGFGPVGLDVRRPLSPVEDVVGREVHERRAQLGRVARAAHVRRRRALGIVLGAVDVRPRGGVKHEVGRRLGRRSQRQRHVPVRPGQRCDVVRRLELRGQRASELPAGARDQDAAAASRSDRIGDRVLQRSATRGSSHGTPCSSGRAGSYSSVTW